MNRETVRKLLQFNTKSKKWDKDIFDGGYFKIRIAKYLIEKMHGKLSIDSESEKGTKYTMVIPQEIAEKVHDIVEQTHPEIKHIMIHENPS